MPLGHVRKLRTEHSRLGLNATHSECGRVRPLDSCYRSVPSFRNESGINASLGVRLSGDCPTALEEERVPHGMTFGCDAFYKTSAIGYLLFCQRDLRQGSGPVCLIAGAGSDRLNAVSLDPVSSARPLAIASSEPISRCTRNPAIPLGGRELPQCLGGAWAIGLPGKIAFWR